MDRRTFLAAASCGLGLAGSLTRWSLAQPAQIGLASQPIRRLTPPKDELIRVACAISQGTTDIDFVGPEAVFETWHRDPVSNKPAPRFKIFTVSQSLDPVGGWVPDFTFNTVPSPHVVVVPAQTGSLALIEWLRKIYATADVTMSVCVGARHLALAGLLTGKQATTHHESLAAFEREFPDVHWMRGARFVETEKISTAAGLTAGIDLALHVVDRYFGREAAQNVAEHLEYDGKRWIMS